MGQDFDIKYLIGNVVSLICFRIVHLIILVSSAILPTILYDSHGEILSLRPAQVLHWD